MLQPCTLGCSRWSFQEDLYWEQLLFLAWRCNAHNGKDRRFFRYACNSVCQQQCRCSGCNSALHTSCCETARLPSCDGRHWAQEEDQGQKVKLGEERERFIDCIQHVFWNHLKIILSGSAITCILLPDLSCCLTLLGYQSLGGGSDFGILVVFVCVCVCAVWSFGWRIDVQSEWNRCANSLESNRDRCEFAIKPMWDQVSSISSPKPPYQPLGWSGSSQSQ